MLCGCGAGEPRTPDPRPYYSRGFTLTEILVVTVIMTILAAVAIPIYTGYAGSKREEAAENLANTAAIAAFAYFKRTGQMPSEDASELNLFLPNSDYIVTIDGENVIVESSDGTITRTVDFLPD